MMDEVIDVKKLATDCMKKIQEAFQTLNALNIMVVGKTGVGKSTLINAMFRMPVAETGIGNKITTHIQEYTFADFPLHIFDTVGLEMDENTRREAIDEIKSEIAKREREHDFNKLVHCIWYCINATSNRIEDSEISFMNNISDCLQESKIPVIIVLTQAYSKKESNKFADHIRKMNLDVAQVIPLVAEDYEMDDDMIRYPYGLDKLVSSTLQILPTSLRDTFLNIQKASLEEKVKRARSIVHKFALITFGEGFVPLPLSDVTAWIPTELGMISRITVVFGIEIKKSILVSLISCLLGSGGTYVIGTTVANFIKLIPSLGTFAGGLIDGATGITLTEAIGEFYIRILAAISKGEIEKSELSTTEGVKKLMEKYRW